MLHRVPVLTVRIRIQAEGPTPAGLDVPGRRRLFPLYDQHEPPGRSPHIIIEQAQRAVQVSPGAPSELKRDHDPAPVPAAEMIEQLERGVLPALFGQGRRQLLAELLLRLKLRVLFGHLPAPETAAPVASFTVVQDRQQLLQPRGLEIDPLFQGQGHQPSPSPWIESQLLQETASLQHLLAPDPESATQKCIHDVPNLRVLRQPRPAHDVLDLAGPPFAQPQHGTPVFKRHPGPQSLSGDQLQIGGRLERPPLDPNRPPSPSQALQNLDENKIAGPQVHCRSGAQAKSGKKGLLDHYLA